jgi:hypothetical protein
MILRLRKALDREGDRERQAFIRWFDRTYTYLVDLKLRPKSPGVYFYDGDYPIAFVAFDRLGNVVSRELISPTEMTKDGLNLFIARHMTGVGTVDLRAKLNSENWSHEDKRGD